MPWLLMSATVRAHRMLLGLMEDAQPVLGEDMKESFLQEVTSKLKSKRREREKKKDLTSG